MLTGNGTHVATKRGAAKGGLVEPGQTVPSGTPVGSWMTEADSTGGEIVEEVAKPEMKRRK
jgi:hypothetical protein